jgi:hypothetical protein
MCMYKQASHIGRVACQAHFAKPKRQQAHCLGALGHISGMCIKTVRRRVK